MFINLSNHPSCRWTVEQVRAAREIAGDIVDIEFPMVSAEASEEDILGLADAYCDRIKNMASPCDCVVHIMGELNFTYAAVKRLMDSGYICVASTTDRVVEELGENIKNVKFDFVRFRKYASM